MISLFLGYKIFLTGIEVIKLAVIIQQIYVRFLKGQTQDKRFANFGKRIEALINRANGVFNFN